MTGATTTEPVGRAADAGRDSMQLLERGLAVALFVAVILLGFLR